MSLKRMEMFLCGIGIQNDDDDDDDDDAIVYFIQVSNRIYISFATFSNINNNNNKFSVDKT